MTNDKLSNLDFDAAAFGLVVPQRPFAPARRSQAGKLLESTGKMALVGEAAEFGDVRQFRVSGEKHALGLENLAFKEEVLGGDAQQFRESAMEMEGAKMNMPGDFAELRPAAEMLAHELDRGHEARQFRVG